MSIHREKYLKKIKKGLEYNPIVVLLGARQVGKTTLMEQYVRNLDALWLNGQNPETAILFQQFSTIEQHLQIQINKNIEGILVIDEFQYIDNISLQMKLLTDKYKKLKILCSGSSSLDILQKVEESLAGRVRTIKVYSLSFTEYLKFIDDELYIKLMACSYTDNLLLLFPKLELLLKEYLLYGGLPKITLAETSNDKIDLLKDIQETYLLCDIKHYINNKDFVGFNKLLRLLSAQIGNLLNINELSNTIQIPYKVCEEYIYILQQMFIVQLIEPFTTNKRSELSKMKKVFFTDLGLRNIIYNSFNDIDIRVDNGQLFENYVFLEIIKANPNNSVNYYRTKDGLEIDFIINTLRGEIIPIEVKFKRFATAKKIRALSNFSKLTASEKTFIINLNNNQDNLGQQYIQPYLLEQI